MATTQELEKMLKTREYRAGFVTDIESDTVPPGLSEDVIRAISAKKGEPQWLLDFRLKAYRRLQLRVSQRMKQSLQEHERIVAAIAAGDGETAERELRAHISVQGERFADLVASVGAAAR